MWRYGTTTKVGLPFVSLEVTADPTELAETVGDLSVTERALAEEAVAVVEEVAEIATDVVDTVDDVVAAAKAAEDAVSDVVSRPGRSGGACRAAHSPEPGGDATRAAPPRATRSSTPAQADRAGLASQRQHADPARPRTRSTACRPPARRGISGGSPAKPRP